MSDRHERFAAKQARYIDTLKLPVRPADTAIIAALDRAHDLRRFEIENYWRRSTYVWGLQLVAFAALALSADKGKFFAPIVILVATLGIVSSLAATLTSRGSRFWQRNWESHVDFLEDMVEGRLHKTVLARNGLPSFSVSRVNECFLEMLLIGWGGAFVITAVTIADPRWLQLEPNVAKLWQIGGPTIFVIIAVFRLIDTRSRLADRLYDLDTITFRGGSD